MQNSESSSPIKNPLVRSGNVEPRLYQQSIAEKACQNNTLVVIPTALGKTIISALAAADFLYNHKQMRVLVMAPTRPLVLQHFDTYMNMLKLGSEDAIPLTGKTPPIYRRYVWDGNARIVFATPQIVKNDLESGALSLQNFSLLVFDECHRARKDYAYTVVAKKYVEQALWPIILGMTASPGADKDKILEICEALYVERVEYRSEEDTDVMSYVHPVEVEWKRVDLPAEYKDISRMIRLMLNERLSWLNRIGALEVKPDYANRRDLLETGERLKRQLESTIKEWKGPIFNAIIVQSASLTLFHALELLETQGASTLAAFLDRMELESEQKRSYKAVTNDLQYTELRRTLNLNIKLEHPKLGLLKETIKSQFMEHPNSKIIVFTQYRDTASHLVDSLGEITQLSVERFVGQASKEGDLGLSQDEQSRILQDFRDGETNLLVATCIAEEGLDIPSVELVIFYEPIPSEIRYIQRKGRTGRKAAGKAVILAANDTLDIAYLYASRRRVEKMRRMVKSLNLQLKPLMRRGTKPETNLMTNEEVLDLEKCTQVSRMQLEDIGREDNVRWFLKEIEKASRYVWKKIVKTSIDGLPVSNLIEEALADGMDPCTVKGAIQRLQDTGQITKIGNDRIAAAAKMPAPNSSVKTDDIYDVEIERIRPGVAVAVLNGKWRARLTPSDFDGPTTLLKKKSRFRARGRIYHDGPVLCFNVGEIVEQVS